MPWSCAAALTDSSQGILGREALAKVKPGLIVKNVGRGGLVDEASLDEATPSVDCVLTLHEQGGRIELRSSQA
jgi:hypothetical protein